MPLTPAMVRSSSELADFSGLVDEQDLIEKEPQVQPTKGCKVPSQHWKKFPFSAVIDLGQPRNLASLWIFDTNGKDLLRMAAGEPGHWSEIANYDCGAYLQWVRLPLDATTRYLQIELMAPGANFAELALYEYTPEAHRAMLEQKAEAERRQKERETALERAREEAARRLWVELPPFGRLQVVDEIDCGLEQPGHDFVESPGGVSHVENILGHPCRVLRPTDRESAQMTFRLGQWKLLKPGGAYVLAVEYPEDAPRSWIVRNGGNETSRGFHTGDTLGDALHPKYVNNNPESLRIPLSGRYETWTLYFNLHDRFPTHEFLRGAGERKLVPEDGFPVTIAQFSARNDPASRGAAVARIRLLEVPEESALTQPLRLPPEPLPRRRIFWREEMADGVIQSDREIERGMNHRLDWYRFKANQMRFLGIGTFSKDLLEFGACQHWDSSPLGGNEWVYFAHGSRELWGQIVEFMGAQGFEVLPYYEYSGSKGQRGLGPQRRCQPLTRDGAYTHISWVESANADLTDPDTHADLKKMLELTVVRLKDRAKFAGIWLRPRWQLPMSFAEAARGRFAREANQGKAVSRADLIADGQLLERYEDWWFGKRREFLAAMRDYLQSQGVANPLVLFTAEASEAGTSFPTWEKRLVTDAPEAWAKILAAPEQIDGGKKISPIPLKEVLDGGLYLEALQAPPMNWGQWEVHHANPPADPARYANAPGLLMTHCFNRQYTVSSPKTFAAFRGAAGLAIIRHYSLNEDMMFDQKDQPKLGYFVCDVERAGPYCMMAEALAVAHGDPTLIGYLLGNNFGRGFPEFVRNFNANFLALPALPSRLEPELCDDREVIVRAIRTPAHGTYLAIVNTAVTAKKGVRIKLPNGTNARDAVSGVAHKTDQGAITLDLYPFELRSVHLSP